MAIRDVTLVVKVDNTDVIRKEKDSERFFRKVNSEVKKQSGLIAQLKFQEEGLIKLRNQTQSPAKIKAFNKELRVTQRELKKLETSGTRSFFNISRSLKNLAGSLALAFSVQRIARFTKEAVILSGEVQGVKRAFDALNQATLLDDLRKATRGTVSDLELMRQAVKAENFRVPLEQLATFFEFATKRAIQTGEGVQFLVESIVTGIGRKSPKIIDNLGISLAAVQEEFKKTGDFGVAVANLIEIELTKMGDVADTTNVRIERFTARIDNLKAAFGQGFVNAVEGSIEAINNFADALFPGKVKLGALVDAEKFLENIGTTLANLRTEEGFEGLLDDIIASTRELSKDNVFEAATLKILEEAFDAVRIAQVKFLETQADLSNLTVEQIRNVAFLEARLKELGMELRNQDATLDENRQTIIETISIRKELDALLGKETQSTKLLTEALEELGRAYNRAREAGDQRAESSVEGARTFRAEILASEQELAQATIGITQASIGVLSELVEEGSNMQKALLVFNKLLAVADILINLQRETSLIGANPTLNLLDPATGTVLKANLIAAANFRAGAGIAAVIATTIPTLQGFAEGTEGSPEGLAWTGERGKELTYLAEGTKVLPNSKVNQFGPAIDAMFHNNFDDYIQRQYIPEMMMNSEGHHNPTDDIYNDYRVMRELKKNKRVIIENEGSLAANIAAAVSANQRQRQRYGF